MPLLVRYFAFSQGKHHDVLVRRAMPREDDPRDGMLHPDNAEALERYSNDMVLEFPGLTDVQTRYFVQLKLSRDKRADDEYDIKDAYAAGICVYNNHAYEPQIRTHMIETLDAITKSLSGAALSDTEKRRIKAEFYRTSSLFPWEISEE